MSDNDGAHRTHPTDQPIRVLIVDDHEVMAASLARVLEDEPDIVSVGVAATLAQARARVQSGAPDVLVLDRRLPDGDGVDAISDLKALRPSMNVLVLTGSSSDDVLAEVTSAVRAASQGEASVSSEMLARLLPRLTRVSAPTPTLTAREEEVLGMLAQGLSNAAIAAELTVSVNTVRNHVANLSAKLGAHSKLEAMSIAIQRGLLSPPQ